MTGKNSRRDFLRGKSDALAERAEHGLLGEVPGRESPSPDSYLLHVSRQAMACQFQVFLNAAADHAGTEAALAALELLDDLEAELSYFRPTSRLSQVNQQAAAGPVEVGPELFALLESALRLSRETDGAWDITATPLWEAWGFARRAGAIPSEGQIAEALQSVGNRFVELDAEQRTVRFLRPGVRLNLGSLGKGYAVDRCAAYLAAAGVEHFLIHGGGSSVVARGDRGGPSSPGAGWSVGLPHPLRRGSRLGEFRLRGRALGTSGGQFQSFWHQGRRYGHILDPRTGRPAQNVLSVTVLAPNGMLADALSTAFFVLGPDAAGAYCATRPEITMAMSVPARKAGGFEVRWANLSPGEFVPDSSGVEG